MSSRSASLYVTPVCSIAVASSTVDAICLNCVICVTRTAEIMPGMMTMKGMSIFGKEPRMGVSRAALIDFDAMARWTSTKFVVQ